MSVIRAARMVPWYHVASPRCDAEIVREKIQCMFTARFTGRPHGRDIYLCKIHADMADFTVKPIRPGRVTLRED